MVRILGHNLIQNKVIYIALTAIYGIGISKAQSLLKKLNINKMLKVSDLTEKDFINIRKYLENNNFKLEGELKKIHYQNIKRLIDINSYRGKRHLKGLPARGQRCRTNSRTCRRLAIFKK